MGIRRLLAVMMIFGCATLAWWMLGTATWVRTERADSRFSGEMKRQIGPEMLAQCAPYWSPTRGRERNQERVAPSASVITADITHENRYKGLLWYSTFKVDFAGRYTIAPAEQGQTDGYFLLRLPANIRGHDGLEVLVDGKAVDVPTDQRASGRLEIAVDRGAERTVSVSFTTFGQDAWVYLPAEVDLSDRYDVDDVLPMAERMSELANFSLTVTTNFRQIDYPKGSQSPKAPAQPAGDGMTAKWDYRNLVTRQPMGVVMPKRINAGPIAARMSFFAPVSLLFFFSALLTVVLLKKIPLHPMHYLFIAAGFFAFHLLLAYLVDILNIHLSFWICAAVSVFLVVSYMRLVAGVKFAVTYVALAQLVYLVGFSYAFFWVGRTGLTVTIGAIATLFVLMQATGRLKWQEVFSRKSPAARAEPVSVAPPPAPPAQSQTP